jgi:hypothetical protein
MPCDGNLEFYFYCSFGIHILWPFGISIAVLVYFSHFGLLYPEKSGNLVSIMQLPTLGGEIRNSFFKFHYESRAGALFNGIFFSEHFKFLSTASIKCYRVVSVKFVAS